MIKYANKRSAEERWLCDKCSELHGPKFFKEKYSHKDIRYVKNNSPPSMAELFEIYEVFMEICDESETAIHPILMHGSLIGWLHGGNPLPWDDDIDVCICGEDQISAFKKLDKFEKKSYFVEINPNSKSRCPYDRHNVIDARLISKKTGTFIDVTFLTPISSDQVSCRSPHEYPIVDIFPLQESKFMGVPCYVPSNVKSVLVSEYGENVMEWKFQNWTFDGNNWKRNKNQKKCSVVKNKVQSSPVTNGNRTKKKNQTSGLAHLRSIYG